MKLASTKLNYLIGIGAIILYIDIFFFAIPATNPDVAIVFCNLTPWLTAIGYSLCYGTILAKMARVYYISTSKKVRCCIIIILPWKQRLCQETKCLPHSVTMCVEQNIICILIEASILGMEYGHT